VRYLIVSDIHANWEALQGVLAASAGLYDEILCCGDLVDYCASPNEICDWAKQECSAVIRGNHDKACCGMDDIDDYNPLAQAAVRWTMSTLTEENFEYLRNLAQGPKWIDETFQLVHGSPYHEDEYLLNVQEIIRARQVMECPLVFFGHTHLPCIMHFHEDRGMYIPAAQPYEDTTSITLEPGDYYLINPGSVGQPRDRDWRAAFVIYDKTARTVTMRRVPYDLAGAQERIRSSGLPLTLAERLARGA
jgi:predicted phosphodiesterase